MLKRLSARERFELLIQQFEPLIRAAFMEAVQDIRSNIQLRVVVERLERGDINGAIQAMHLDEAAFRPLDEAIRQAYSGGGVAAVEGMPELREPDGLKVVIRFDARLTRAETYVRQHAAELVQGIVADQITSVRETMAGGLAEGKGARSIGLEVTGRINRATGRREGGILGITSQQAAYVRSMRMRLLSGDPTELRKVLSMGRRDRRFDGAIAKAIKTGKAIPAEQVARITDRYADRLLLLRGETIARTEGMAAINAAQMEAYQQAIDSGKVNAADVRKRWEAAGDNRVRHSHEALNKQDVGFYEGFMSPSGAVLRYPHDPDAPAEETINCRCRLTYRIDFLARFRGRV